MNAKRAGVFYGSLGLIILETVEALGPLHGYRIDSRIEQISGDHLTLVPRFFTIQDERS